MLVAPVVLGAMLAERLDWRHVLLLAFVLVGYLAFFATGLWLKARRRPRYLPPVQAYLPAAAAVGLLVAVSAPHLVRWAPLFVVPMAVGLYASATRDERSIWSGLATTAGATLLTPVAFDVAGDWSGRTATVWWATSVLGGYFAGTVFYVKTMIRERGAKGWWVASVLWHLLVIGLVALGPVVVGMPWGAVVPALVVAVALLARAAVLPRYPLTPTTVGMLEIVVTVGVVVCVWSGAAAA